MSLPLGIMNSRELSIVFCDIKYLKPLSLRQRMAIYPTNLPLEFCSILDHRGGLEYSPMLNSPREAKGQSPPGPSGLDHVILVKIIYNTQY